MNIVNCGIYVISDEFFTDFPYDHLHNKLESRPYFLAIRERNGIIWFIPISSKVDKYRDKIRRDEDKHGECLFYYIARFKGKDHAFLIGNAIPVTERYIKKPFTVRGAPYILQNEDVSKKLVSKLRRFLAMVRIGKLHPNVDILAIERELLRRA